MIEATKRRLNPLTPMAMLPKLSYILTAYNRQKFVREAVLSALQQDYQGELQIIISDDCSTDDTYRIIQDTVAQNPCPHEVIITQTPKNCQLADNTNHALQFATGDWVIRADDDDLSSRDRCSIISEAIQRFPEATAVIHPSLVTSSPEELNQEQFGERSNPITYDEYSLGALLPLPNLGFPLPHYQYKAWSKRVYDEFPPLPSYAFYIDDYMAYVRAIALGSCIKINGAACTLVYQSSENQSGNGASLDTFSAIKAWEIFLGKYYASAAPSLETLASDLRRYFQDANLSEDTKQLINFLEHKAKVCTVWKGFHGQSWKGRLSKLKQIKELEHHLPLYTALKALPLNIFCTAICMAKKINRIRHARKG